MKESVTYQAIIEEGRAEGEAKGALTEARKLLLIQGSSRFGLPDARVRAALERIKDLAQLEALGVQLLTAQSWQELLGLPALRRRR